MDTTNWKWFRYDELFEIHTFKGKNALNSEQGNVPFISASALNNGVSLKISCDIPERAGKITVARNGSVGSAFFQPMEFCASPDDIRIFELKNANLNSYIALFLCTLIEKEKYRYAYGRKFGTGRMKEQKIKLPVTNIGTPDWIWIENYVKDYIVPQMPKKSQDIWTKQFKTDSLLKSHIKLDVNKWHWFRYDEIFDIKKGFYNKKPAEDINGEIPFVGASDSNNGITSYHNLESIEESSKTGKLPNAPIEDKLFEGNSICVTNNGSVGFAYYQPKVFTCTHDVHPLFLNPKWDKDMNKFIALFLCTLIEKERYRWAYGRKWRPKRMPSSLIKLPYINGEDGNGNSIKIPDWQFMEDYIKSLPYSSCL